MIHVTYDTAVTLGKQALADLKAQGRCATDAMSHCVYLNSQDHSCIFGLLVKRLHPEFDLADPTITNVRADGVIRLLVERKLSTWDSKAVHLMLRMQKAHDHASCSSFDQLDWLIGYHAPELQDA